MIKRPLVLITIGSIIGILFGLYCNISIALFVACAIFIISYILAKYKNAKRYDNTLQIQKWSIIFIICILIGSIYTTIKSKEYENHNRQMQKGTAYIGTIISNSIQKEYYTQYELRIEKIGQENTNIKLYLHYQGKQNLEYGDKIALKGEYIEPDIARNDKGFNYKNYLKSNGIVGTLKAKNIEILSKNNGNLIKKFACKTRKIYRKSN